MSQISGHQLIARTLKSFGVTHFFYLLAGPCITTAQAMIDEGMTGIDVRHEQAAAMMAHAWGRLTGQPGVCMAGSGPGMTNLITGIANAYVDATPMLALGGAASVNQFGMEAFQEFDQLSMVKPITKWAERAYTTRRLPELVATAFRQATAGRLGPVYLDLPGDTLYGMVEEDRVEIPRSWGSASRPMADPEAVERAISLLAKAERPILVTGSGVLWSQAAEEMRAFVDATGIPFYTTPQGRGVVAEDHPLAFVAARNTAFREADVALVVGTRFNFIVFFGRSPKFAPDVKVIHVNVEPEDIGKNRAAEVGIVADAKMAFRQLTAAASGRIRPEQFGGWVERLRRVDEQRWESLQANMNSDAKPVHPLRVCKEVKEFMQRDAVLVVDGHETLNYARQSIPTFAPGHRLNSGANGCMGVGVPYAIGAAIAKPDKQVILLSGDGSFSMNMINLDVCVRHHIPLLCVLSNNQGWTGARRGGGDPPGRWLLPNRYDKLIEDLGGYGECVEDPAEIRPALDRAYRRSQADRIPAVVNVMTDPYAKATTGSFGGYSGFE